MSETLSYQEYLDRHASLTYTNVGTSMMPLLREGRDLFIVVPKTGRCHVGDVTLYHRAPNSWVLHRVVKVLPKGYLMLGDNSVARELVAEDDVIGVMQSFVRDGRKHDVSELGYRAYTRAILVTERPRVLTKRMVGAIRRRLVRWLRHEG